MRVLLLRSLGRLVVVDLGLDARGQIAHGVAAGNPLDVVQGVAAQSAFSEKDNTKAGYFLRERGIGFCWSCEHLRGRSYVENSIKSVEVKEA